MHWNVSWRRKINTNFVCIFFFILLGRLCLDRICLPRTTRYNFSYEFSPIFFTQLIITAKINGFSAGGSSTVSNDLIQITAPISLHYILSKRCRKVNIKTMWLLRFIRSKIRYDSIQSYRFCVGGTCRRYCWHEKLRSFRKTSINNYDAFYNLC